ncbi:hypothetical protein [Roseivirga echinicomitans]|nr:hypothetical protein [Roseivirga echinicomitans]
MKTYLNLLMNKQNLISNVILSILFFYSFFLIGQAYIQGLDIGNWIWDRHQNLFSWYSRPLFIIPACYFAYHHKLWHTGAWMALMFASLFWFSAPQQVSESVQAYLEWENKLFFNGDSIVPLVVLIAGVLAFLFGLFYAFYRRNMWYGLLVFNIGTLLKIFVSLTWGKETGVTAIVPSLSSMLFINIVAWLLWKRTKKKKFEKKSN